MRAEVADHGAQRSRNEHADPVAEVRLGSFATVWSVASHFRSSPNIGHNQIASACLKSASTRLAHRNSADQSRRTALLACHSSPVLAAPPPRARSPTNSTDCSRKTDAD